MAFAIRLYGVKWNHIRGELSVSGKIKSAENGDSRKFYYWPSYQGTGKPRLNIGQIPQGAPVMTDAFRKVQAWVVSHPCPFGGATGQEGGSYAEGVQTFTTSPPSEGRPLVPTWKAVSQIIALALEHGTEEGRRLAKLELATMAEAADRYNASLTPTD